MEDSNVTNVNKNNNNSNNSSNSNNNNYIPWFLNNNENSSFNSNNNIVSPVKNQPDISLLTYYKQYQSVFDQLTQQITLWNAYDQNQLTVLNSIAYSLERLHTFMNNDLQQHQSSTSQFSHFKGNYNSNLTNNNNSINNNNSSNKSVIMNILKLQQCEKLEELMRSLLRYNETKRKIIEKMSHISIEVQQYWNKTIQEQFQNDSNYTRQLDFNAGTVTNLPLSNLHEWLDYIFHSYKQEFFKKDELIKKIDYTKQDELLKIINIWETQTLVDSEKVKELLILANSDD